MPPIHADTVTATLTLTPVRQWKDSTLAQAPRLTAYRSDYNTVAGSRAALGFPSSMFVNVICPRDSPYRICMFAVYLENTRTVLWPYSDRALTVLGPCSGRARTVL